MPANEMMQKLFAALEMHYEFTLGQKRQSKFVKKAAQTDMYPVFWAQVQN